MSSNYIKWELFEIKSIDNKSISSVIDRILGYQIKLFAFYYSHLPFQMGSQKIRSNIYYMLL
jgi:hypothetical protein